MKTAAPPLTGSMSALLAVVLVAICGLCAASYAYYTHERASVRTARLAELKAIAHLKADTIAEWRSERLLDARLAASGLIRTLTLSLENGVDDGSQRRELLAYMALFQKFGRYENVIVARPDDSIVFAANPVAGDHAQEQSLIQQAIAARDGVLGELYRCPVCEHVHLDAAAPILDGQGRTVAVLILRTDPEVTLFPLVQLWPTPSRTSETLLVRKDGSDTLLLNVLRHTDAPPLTIRFPLSNTDIPAVQVVLGATGEFEGHDYRGVDVLAEILPIESSPWFLVSKGDKEELFAEFNAHSRLILYLLVLAILLVAGVGFSLHRGRVQRLREGALAAEREAWKNAEEARVTLYCIGDGVISTDAAGRVVRMNPTAEALTGWTEASARGRAIQDVFRIVNEATRAVVENPIERVLREGVVVGLANHTMLIAQDGNEHPIGDSAAPIRDQSGVVTGVVLVFRDQSEERTTRAFLGNVVNAIADPVFVKDERRRFVIVNDALCAMVGRTRDVLLGETGYDMFPEEQCVVFRKVDAEILETGVENTNEEELSNLATGETRAIVTRKTRYVDPTGQRFIVGVIRDITDGKRLQQERQRFEATLQQQQKLESIGTLASGVAHEINNPLNIVMNFAQLILDEQGTSSTAREFATHIVNESARMAVIVKNLLAFSRNDKETHSPADVATLVDTTLSLVRASFRNDQIDLVAQVPAGLPKVRCRSQQIQQVLMNLLTNARDASNDRFPGASADKKITLDVSRFSDGGCDWLRLTVEDRGSGIPSDVAARVFEPFYSTKPKHKGSGMGLSISHGIVKDHGGRLWFESEDGAGTRFYLELKVDADPSGSAV